MCAQFTVLQKGSLYADIKNPYAQIYYEPGTNHDILQLTMRDRGGNLVAFYLDPSSRQIYPFLPEAESDAKFFKELPAVYTAAATGPAQASAARVWRCARAAVPSACACVAGDRGGGVQPGARRAVAHAARAHGDDLLL
jgi:hypothetical protein